MASGGMGAGRPAGGHRGAGQDLGWPAPLGDVGASLVLGAMGARAGLAGAEPVGWVSPREITIQVHTEYAPLIEALEEAGFQRRRTLVTMRYRVASEVERSRVTG